MRLTGPGVWGAPADRPAALRVLRRALELGVNFIDTADSYGPGVSEEIIAEALHPYPPGLVIATKGGLTRAGPGHWGRDAHPAHLRAACEGSLRRLRLARIDLYQLHAVDPARAARRLARRACAPAHEGKIRHIGVSNVSARSLRARAAHRDRGLGAESLQPRGSRLGGCAEELRARRDRLHSLVSTRGGSRCGQRAARDRLAARAFAGDAADSRHIIGCALEENVAAASLRLSAREMQAMT
jgi:aryl-alcohol dehydrogenase-like predicted oxidoreductase